MAADGGGAVAFAGEDVSGREKGIAFFADHAVVVVNPAGVADAEGQLRVRPGARRRSGHLLLELLRRPVPARHPELDVARIDDVVPQVERAMVVRRTGDVAPGDRGAIVAVEALFRHHAESGGRRGRVRLTVDPAVRHEAPGPHAGVWVGPGVIGRGNGPVAELRRDVGAGAVADVIERRHLVDGRAAKIVPEVTGRDDGVVGAGGLVGATGGEVLCAQRLDLARLQSELAAGFHEPEGEGAVFVSSVTQGDFADGEIHLSDGSGIKGVGFQDRLEAIPRVVILAADVANAPAAQFDVKDIGQGISVGDHRDPFELDRDIVGIVDHDDRVDGHAEGAVRVGAGGIREHAGEDHREADDAGRQAHRGRPRPRGGLREGIEITIAGRRARDGDAHAVEVGDNVAQRGGVPLGAVVIVGEDVRVAQTLFGLEAGRIARCGEIVAIVVAIGRHGATAGVEVFRPGGLVPVGPAGAARRAAALHRLVAVTGSVGQRFDASGDDGISRRGGLAAEGAARLSGLLDLTLIHAVVVAVEIPRRAADDAADEVLGVIVEQFGPRAHVYALSEVVAATGDTPGRRGGVGTVLGVGDEARDRDTRNRVGIGIEEGRTQRRFVDEAEAFRRLVAIPGDEGVVGVAEHAPEIAWRPFRGTRRGEE